MTIPNPTPSEADIRSAGIHFIVNPTAGAGRVAGRWRTVESELRAAGLPYTAVHTQFHGHARDLAISACRAGASIVACVGGDGTVNEIADGLLSTGRPPGELPALAMVPAGTGSDFARGLRQRHTDAYERLKRGHRRRIDAGLISYTASTGAAIQRHFVNVAGLGFDAAVGEIVNASDKREGQLAYFRTVFQVLRSFPNTPVTVVAHTPAGAQTLTQTVTAVIVANGQMFGGGMPVAHLARLDDGLLDVVVVGGLNTPNRLTVFARMYLRTHLSHSAVRHFLATEIEVIPATGARLPLEAEGESLGAGPARFRVLPGALDIIV
jgi:YegS/Rv2252/BmrU family lipid kinase